MNKTAIEWVKNPDGTQGYTWNPITGCLNGCEYCYARRLAHWRLKSRYLANNHTAPRFYGEPFVEDILVMNDPFYPRFWPQRMSTFFQGKPRGVFVCDMSDLFGIGIPEEWTREVLGTIKRSPAGWRFYLLTKQPQNLIKFSPFPDNCWVGVTATDAKMAEDAGFWLWEVKAKVKFVSFEPLLERIPIHFTDYISEDVEGINWLIIGAQTPYSPKTAPKIGWVQEIVEAADKANIPVFLKDNLRPLLPHRLPFCREVSFGGRFLIYRQEFPRIEGDDREGY